MNREIKFRAWDGKKMFDPMPIIDFEEDSTWMNLAMDMVAESTQCIPIPHHS